MARPLPKLSSTHSVETFRLDRLALDAFPTETWNHLAASRLSGGAAGLLSHGEPLGFPPLRAAIAEYIRDTRGIRCNAEQVVITSGTQQSLDLVARLLLERGDPVWVEDPGYVAAASVLRAHGAEVIGVPVDAQGIDCDAGRQRCPFARLAYVTPVCQFPLGVPISAERRLRLLQWADDAGAWIFEDDHDPQLQLEDQPPAPLFNQDRASSVIYSCSFNRILFSSLRLGFLILPPSLVGPAATALSITQRYHPVLEQAVLADFMEQGHLQVHVRQMREIYRARREALLESGRAELGDLMQFNHSQAFLQTIGWLASGMSEAHVWQCAAARNIDSIPLSNLTIERRMPPALVLGIGGADAAAIRLAMKRLSRALRLLAWRPKRFEASPSIGARST